MRQRGFGKISDVAASEFLHLVGVHYFFYYNVPMMPAKNWRKLKLQPHFRGYGCWCWDLAELPLKGCSLSPDSSRNIGCHGDNDGGYHDLVCIDFWKWETYILSTRRSGHVRVTLKTHQSPLYCIFGQCIHVSRVNPWIMGPFYWWQSIVKLQRWAKREAGERSKKLGGNWYSLGIQSRSKNKRYYWAWLRKNVGRRGSSAPPSIICVVFLDAAAES